MRWHLAALPGAALALGACKNEENIPQHLRSVRVVPANIVYPNAEKFVAGDVTRLLTGVRADDEVHVLTSLSGPAAEPPLPAGVPRHPDLDVLGYQKSSFLADSRWATIRFLGADPAGAGLEGDAQDKAQMAALGKVNDTIPVTTAAWAATRIMNDFFAPLLETLPGGKEILAQFKIQGAYFAPGYVPTGLTVERDNAFLVGLQSLHLWPSSCFERAPSPDCPAPYMSTAHDPTIIGHEVAHAVFNHMRKGHSLDGFQWGAVNEGYADYFSAAYFSEPIIGRIWKVSTARRPYLRTLSEQAQADDPKLSAEIHQFGIVWGSTLWRLRNRLVKELDAKPQEVDRIFLFAITFLGETSKIRLGDAASAVLKAAEALDATPYKKIMREEFELARISLGENRFSGDALPVDGSAAAAPGSRASSAARSGSGAGGGCGVVANASSVTTFWPGLLPLLLPLLLRRRRS